MSPFAFRIFFVIFCVVGTVLPAIADGFTPTTVEPQAVVAASAATTLYGVFDPTRPCTGILIDARHLKDVRRCQSPFLLAADADALTPELYPDPKCLPNLNELQEEGIVRFYHSVSEARKGFVGDNPYIIRAQKCSGPYAGDLVVSKEDAAVLRELEQKIHYTQTWHVGFLLPDGR